MSAESAGVAVVIPVHNGTAHLPEAIESALDAETAAGRADRGR